ncbi:hypothetical protein [Pedobacter sp. P26]|uniref:hypothetical protein n=1 Tax=Pedobacter sp. P26 TaxID=3423956 RepID=UPI003D668238
MKIKTNWILPSLFLTVTWTALSAQDLADKRLAEKPVDTSIVFFNPKKSRQNSLKLFIKRWQNYQLKKRQSPHRPLRKATTSTLFWTKNITSNPMAIKP